MFFKGRASLGVRLAPEQKYCCARYSFHLGFWRSEKCPTILMMIWYSFILFQPAELQTSYKHEYVLNLCLHTPEGFCQGRPKTPSAWFTRICYHFSVFRIGCHLYRGSKNKKEEHILLFFKEGQRKQLWHNRPWNTLAAASLERDFSMFPLISNPFLPLCLATAVWRKDSFFLEVLKTTKTKHLLEQAKIYFSVSVSQEGFVKKHSSLNKTLFLQEIKLFFFFFKRRRLENNSIIMKSILNIKNIEQPLVA